VLAGTVLLAVDGTVATLSDTESVPVTVAAGRLALPDPAPDGQQRVLAVGPAAAPLPVHPEFVGGGTAELRLWAEDTHRQDPCETDLVVTVTLSQGATPLTGSLCSLAERGADLATVNSRTAPDLSIAVAAAVPPEAGPRAGRWRGGFRVTLKQASAGGFSDEQRIPVHVVVPNQQGSDERPASGGRSD